MVRLSTHVSCLIFILGLATSAWANPIPETASLSVPTELAAGGQYGYQTATNGQVAATWRLNTNRVHLFSRDATTGAWSALKTLSPTGTTVGFGRAMDFDGARLVVADPAGKTLYMFERDAGGPNNWGEVKRITRQAGLSFGESVALRGDLLVIGDPIHDNGSGTRTGRVYVFGKDTGGPGNWGEIAQIPSPSNAAGDWFGVHVAVTGTTVAVGAYESSNSNRGSLNIYEPTRGGGYQLALRVQGTQNAGFLGGVGVTAHQGQIAVTERFRVRVYGANLGVWSEQSSFALPTGLISRAMIYEGRIAVHTGALTGLYERDAQGAWSRTAQLRGTGAVGASFQLNIPVDYEGGAIVVGAWRHTVQTDREGTVWVFVDDDACAAGVCDAVASCTDIAFSATCICPTGYTDPMMDGSVCQDIDECVADPCDANATCTNTPGAFTCACNAGYTGDGASCADVDECASDPCDANATCTNAPGTFACACDPGYMGDGMMCQDVDECAAATANCDANAACTNTPGAFTCACDAGFTGDGLDCADVDECTNDPCSALATCTNTPGTFTCACEPGYQGDGLDCADIDECVAGTSDCDADATCTNIPGAFTCACNDGFSGDGVSCADIDECADSPCGENATCTNTPGAFACACDAGYTGDGITCVDVDECADDPCDANATCTNAPGTFTCACDDGFMGDGTTCAPVDPCAQADACGANQVCEADASGLAVCACVAGYEADASGACVEIVAPDMGDTQGGAVSEDGCATTGSGRTPQAPWGLVLLGGLLWGLRRRWV